MGISLTPMVKNILLITIGVFFLQNVVPVFNTIFTLYPVLASHFYPFQFVSYIFLHGSLGHIFSNMLGLIVFGPMLETVWGPKRFLVFYLITGIGAGLIQNGINYYEVNKLENIANQFLLEPTFEHLNAFSQTSLSGGIDDETLEIFKNNPTDPENIRVSKTFVRESIDRYLNSPNIGMVGASGAIFGIMAAFALLFPNTELMLLFFPFPIKAKYFVLLYGVVEYFSGIQRTEGDNVAHFAHLGGMLFGFILVKYWGNSRKHFY